jgi:ribokinase
MERDPAILVPGGLNTDFILTGVDRLLKPGELGAGTTLDIKPGGKSRNIAQMIARLTEPGSVAMLGRTVRDEHGLWKAPYEALKESGVNVDHVKVLSPQEAGTPLPGIALIPVDREGKNQIYLYPGANAGFSPADLDDAEKAFEKAGAKQGILALSLEMPMETAAHAIALAKRHALKVVLDPGGISPSPTPEQLAQYRALLNGVDLFKPNEHETKVLTDIAVVNLQTAVQAAEVLRGFGVGAVLITAGKEGAYLIAGDVQIHIPIPDVQTDKSMRDETGCGDQTMAGLCAGLLKGDSLEQAAKTGILAGTLQFYRKGVQPVSREDIAAQGA